MLEAVNLPITGYCEGMAGRWEMFLKIRGRISSKWVGGGIGGDRTLTFGGGGRMAPKAAGT